MADIVNKGYWGNMSLGTRFLCNRNIGRQSNRALVMKWSSILQKSFRNDNVKENVTLKYVFAQLQMFRAFSILLASYNEIFRVVFSRPVQTLATTRNIVGPNNVVSCCAMLADVCKRSQQVATCWVFRWENKGLWDVFHLRRHFYFLFASFCVDTGHVVRVHRRNIVGCAVQTNATLLDHASKTAKQ